MSDDATAATIPGTAPVASSASAASPDPRYVLASLLGRGGMGEVWLAHDTHIDRDIAIKLMRGESRHDPDAVARFLREARVQGRLEHPAVVPVHDVGEASAAAPFFVMKRLTGTTLADVLAAQARGDADARTRWSRRALLSRLVDIALAIEFAHARGVIHRDLKPANLMLGDYGEAYVLDWGLARIDEADVGAGSSGGDAAAGQTVAGTMLGTPGYIAPEQLRGEAVDRRVDVYALGLVLFEVLVGAPAIPPADLLAGTLGTACHHPRARAPEADVPPELDELCARATTAAPADRLGSAREIADAIQRYLDGDRDLEARRALAADHAREAMAARAAGDDDAARAAAMGATGRALALDPANRAAQDLMAQLLFELPSRVPAEARREVDAERQRAGQALLKAGGYAYLIFFGVVLVAGATGLAGQWPLIALGVLLGALAALLLTVGRRPRPISAALFATAIALHGVMLGCFAILVGPLLVVPMVAVGAFSIIQLMPTARYPRVAFGVHLLAIAVPLALEYLGVVPTTFSVRAGGLDLHPWAVHASTTFLVGAVLVGFVIQLTVNGIVITRLQAREEEEQVRRHVQAWKLSQLVPPRRPT